jgi:hypothetical protein
VLAPVLVGLGLFSVLSATCLLWLQRLQPLFFAVAVGSLAYQIWAVYRRPPTARTRGIKTILAVSVALNVLMIGGWIALEIRYR